MERSRLLPLAGAAGLAAALTAGITMLAPGAAAREEEEHRAARPARPELQATRRARALQQARVSSRRAGAARTRAVLRHIIAKRDEAWRWERLMTGHPRSRYSETTAARARSAADGRRALRFWTKRADGARRRALRPPRLTAWLCIHRHEGAWNDPNPPYFGGLQMNMGFQQAYGRELLARKGTADNWTPIEQIWVAERAYRSGRGFYPWPNTARACGLL
jgi:hypothetical protein